MQEPIELILVKHWASYIAVPVFLVDRRGNLIFYNLSAETILGRTYDEAGEINAAELQKLFETQDLEGNEVASEDLPLGRALAQRVPAHSTLRIRSFDGSWRTIDATAIPIIGQGDRHLGAMAVFWEME